MVAEATLKHNDLPPDELLGLEELYLVKVVAPQQHFNILLN